MAVLYLLNVNSTDQMNIKQKQITIRVSLYSHYGTTELAFSPNLFELHDIQHGE